MFQEHHLPRGLFEYRGRKVDPGAIRKTALLTVEGERDDICGLGQTMAAQDLCTAIKPFRKKHYVQAGVGHYGVFSGTPLADADLSDRAQHHPREQLAIWRRTVDRKVPGALHQSLSRL